jgi:molecular chaperone GrpE (heat shock protein)
MSSTEDTFEAILSDFKKRLTPKELEDFQITTLQDVRETALRIQRDQEIVKKMMNMTRIESFLEAMDQFSKVIEVFLNASMFVAFIWGPLKFILQVSHPVG